MGLKNTDKTWEGRRHVLQWHRAPCLVQRTSQKYRQKKRDGPAGKYSNRNSRWEGCWAKGHRVFSAIHLKSNCVAQAGAVKLHLGVEWILYEQKRQQSRAPCVA